MEIEVTKMHPPDMMVYIAVRFKNVMPKAPKPDFYVNLTFDKAEFLCEEIQKIIEQTGYHDK